MLLLRLVRPVLSFWIAAGVARRLSRLTAKLGVTRADYILDHNDDEHLLDIPPSQRPRNVSHYYSAALSLRCSTRAELLTRLGAILDAAREAGAGGEAWSASAERRFCEVAARVSRDAALCSLSARASRARKMLTVRRAPTTMTTDLVEELRGPLTRLGELQAVLCEAAQDREAPAWSLRAVRAAAAVAGLKFEDDVVGDLGHGEVYESRSLGGFVTTRRRPLKRPPKFSQMATQLVEACYQVRYGRPSDDDAVRLRLAARRGLAARLGVALFGVRLWVVSNRWIERRGGLRPLSMRLSREAGAAAKRRVLLPVKEIASDLLLKNDAALGDPQAVADSERSLERMLEDWYRDNERSLSKRERHARVAKHDMSAVTDTLAREVRASVRNLLSGNIVRALLIQLQFASTEVYRLMSVVDDLFAANAATVQLLALFPAAFLLIGLIRTLRTVSIALLSESVKSTDQVRREMAATLSDAQRIVLIAQPDLALTPYALGALALHVHIFRERAAREKARFHPTRLARLDRALRDLFIPNLSAEQVNRLFRNILHENDFLRIDDAPKLPLPLTLVQRDHLRIKGNTHRHHLATRS